MTIRLAQDLDIPVIIELFKISLGDQGGIPEESFWKWKHHQNPFGKSPTLLAFEGDKLIGLRTFLCWRFCIKKNKINMYRAVDTATHPDYRGKGVFQRLTVDLLEKLKKGESSLIFNTPNSQSISGYFKMGWKEFGKTPLWIKPLPQYWLANRLNPEKVSPYSVWSAELEDVWTSIESDYKEITDGMVTTDYSIDYLRWRYRDIPGFSYHNYFAKQQSDKVLIFYRVKRSGRLRELRITDIFFNRKHTSLVKLAINKITATHKPDVLTVLEDEQGLLRPLMPFGFWPAKRAGLMVTYREVNDKSLTALAAQPKKWFLTSGTIELF